MLHAIVCKVRVKCYCWVYILFAAFLMRYPPCSPHRLQRQANRLQLTNKVGLGVFDLGD